MKKIELKKFILDFYQAWKDRDKNKIRLFYDDHVIAYADYQQITLDDIFTRLEDGCKKFSHSIYNIEDLFIDEKEGKIAIRMNQCHIHSDGSGESRWQAIMLYKVINHKIIELWMSYFPNSNYLKEI